MTAAPGPARGRWRTPAGSRRWPVIVVLFAAVLGGCSTAGRQQAQPGAEAVSPPGPPATPRESPTRAVSALLEAEQAGDHLASFLLVSLAARTSEASAGDWVRRRRELPPITGFRIEREEGDDVTAVVEHEPGLDPFIGLSPARERQTWTARRAEGGWLLDPEPKIELLLPPPAAAGDAALAWAAAVQRCDQAAARALQAVDTLFGTSDAPAGLCGTSGAVTAARPAPLPPGPASQELVAQYGTEVFGWATTVAISGPVRPFHLVLAPIGDTWQVLALFES